MGPERRHPVLSVTGDGFDVEGRLSNNFRLLEKISKTWGGVKPS